MHPAVPLVFGAAAGYGVCQAVNRYQHQSVSVPVINIKNATDTTTVFVPGNAEDPISTYRTTYDTLPMIAPFGITPHQAAEWAEDMQYTLDHQHELHLIAACKNVTDCMNTYSHLDWDSVSKQAQSFAAHLDGNMALATRFAVLRAHKHHARRTSTVYFPPATTTGVPMVHIATVTNGAGSQISLSSYPTTVDGTAYVTNTTSLYNIASAACQNPIPTPPICHGRNKNMTECRYLRCMLKHLQPIQLTKIVQAAEIVHGTATLEPVYSWYTHPATVTTPHWGTTVAGMSYYPHTPTLVTAKHGRETQVAMQTIKPGYALEKPQHAFEAQPPSCWSLGTCCNECRKNSRKGWLASSAIPSLFHKYRYYLILAALLSLLSCLLCCCLPPLRRFHRRTRDDKVVTQEKVTVVDPASGTESVVVTSTSGQTTTPPTNALVTAAAVTAANDDRGTTGRRAEEGRGKLPFTAPPATGTTTATNTTDPKTGEKVVVVTPPADQSKPAAAPSAAPAVMTSTTPAPAPEPTTRTFTPADREKTPAEKEANASQQRAEAAAPTAPEQSEPVAVHDGVFDYRGTGIEAANMGSIRGRKRAIK
ncbi:hypothetical protein LTR53_003090 [Teratosphaeriaceae sp. CCFEE 6253]|nr:hypothetical protein LTR53_003090 [Teratosphaeriaceae sp. CCFEE 6253]